MSCQDTRAFFPPLLAGELRLTELVEIETHVRQCDKCGHALDRFYAVMPKKDPDRLRLPVSTAKLVVTLAGCAVAVMLAAGIGGYAYQRWHDPPIAGPGAPPPERLSSPAAPEEPRAGIAASAPAVPTERPAVMPPPPVSPPDPKTIAKSAASRAAPASVTDVIVQVFPQDRNAAERNLTLLITRLGGSRLARDQRAVRVTVPRSRYDEFTRGLGQLGTWQIETRKSSLSDPVKVMVKLAR